MAYFVFPMPFSALWLSVCCPEKMTLPSPRVSLRTGRVQRPGMPSVYRSRYTLRRRTIPDWALSLRTVAQGGSG